MNEEALDYIRAHCTYVSPVWDTADVFRQLAEDGISILVSGSERWVERVHVDVSRQLRTSEALHRSIRLERRNRIELHGNTYIDFIASSSTSARFAGYSWHAAFLEPFMAIAVNDPGSMPVWRIPPKAHWHLIGEAVDDAVEFLRTRGGEAEFDFQGNRYRVPYDCDYCVMIGALMPEPPEYRFGFSGWRDSPTVANSYAGISRSNQSATAAQQQLAQAANGLTGLLAAGIGSNALGGYGMSEFINESARRVADEFFRPSPIFERLRQNNPQTVTGGAQMRNPIQFTPQDPMDFPGMNVDGATYWHGQPPYFQFQQQDIPWGVTASARELDLQRRLDTVRECIGSMPNPLTFRDPATAQRFAEALNYTPPVQDLDSYVYRYEFVNGQALRVDDKLKGGTILDAAARPVRKFRIVEE